MFKLPNTFRDENEKYVTVPVLKTFTKGNINVECTADRSTLMKRMISYANNDLNQEIEVRNWLDSIIKEGIKDVYVKAIVSNNDADQILSDSSKIENLLSNEMTNVHINNICGNDYNEKLTLVKYEIKSTKRGRVISFYMCKMIHSNDRKNQTRALIYPVFVDLYIDKKMIAGRAKSKSNMYIYNKDGFNAVTAINITAEKEIQLAINKVLNYFNIVIKKTSESNTMFRKKLYRILDKFTHTPLLIQDKLDDNKEFIENTTTTIINNVCGIKESYVRDVQYDVTNMLEKYFSITYPDKTIFITDRDAYPLKIIATDEEESHVEQTAPAEEPLQSKAVFFDNKKMMQKSELCDGVLFIFNRIVPKYFSKSFNIKIIVKKDYCLFKFTEYTREDDIDHVLFSVIDA
ncbi:MAG: hypothetical protein ACERKZ_05760 [Lachnotalea sp.]